MLVYFENNFYENEADLQHENPDALAAVTIDGYPENEDASGEVICRIYITKHGDMITDWHDKTYAANETVQNLINEAKTTLQQEWKGRNQTDAC